MLVLFFKVQFWKYFKENRLLPLYATPVTLKDANA
jgi:hypothetical protein